ncbi:MAG TPA: response regulator [candidate division Zixibacteria bacterium]|nr:response regulator [candidate division Zixibacteria bacterium]
MVILLVAEPTGVWCDLRDKLDAAGHIILQTPNCSLARKELDRRVEIDLVIVDAGEFGRRGMDFIKWIKGNPRYQPIPVIMAGTSFDEGTLSHYIELGVNDIILLPVQAATLDAKLAKARATGKRTVLVVDDEPVIVEVLKEFLELERYRVLTAGDAESALELLEEEMVDVVVSDIMLPGMQGTELLIEVKRKYNPMPVILITGCSKQAAPRRAIETGADGYFAKPFHNKDLAFTLRKVLLQYDNRRRSASVAPPSVPS